MAEGKKAVEAWVREAGHDREIGAKRSGSAVTRRDPGGAPEVAPLIVFLDANVLFSAALVGPAFELIWELAHQVRVRLVTGAHCRIEAGANLERKRPRSIIGAQ